MYETRPDPQAPRNHLSRYGEFYTRIIIFLFVATILGGPLSSDACTTFSALDKSSGAMMYGRSYDRGMRDALVIINQKNITKRAQVSGNPAQWTSKYGSITFNQYGRDFPLGGMNEEGLVVEVMILPNGSTYSPDANSPDVNVTQWVQYQLDNAANLKQAIDNAQTLGINDTWVPLHYLVCDPQACATIEFINGKAVIHSGDDLGVTVDGVFVPVRALSNSPYGDSLNELKKYSGFGGNAPLPTDPAYTSKESSKTVPRFIRAAAKVKELEDASSSSPISVDMVFDGLDFVTQIGNATQFQIVYDLKNKAIHWRNVYDAAPEKGVETTKPRTVTLESVDFACTSPTQVTNMQDPADPRLQSELKDVPYDRFVNYATSYNQELVEEADRKEIHLEKEAKNYLSSILPADLYATESDAWWAKNFMEPLWYKYPEKFTKCGAKVENIDIFNFYLELLLPPISKMTDNSIKANGWDPRRKVASGDKNLGTYPVPIVLPLTVPILVTCDVKVDLSYSVTNMKGLSTLQIDSLILSENEGTLDNGTDSISGKLTSNLTANFSGNVRGKVLKCGGIDISGLHIDPTIPYSGTITAEGGTMSGKGDYKAELSGNNRYCINALNMNKLSLDYTKVPVKVVVGDWGILKPVAEKITSAIVNFISPFFKGYITNTVSVETKGILNQQLKEILPLCM